MSEVRFCFLYPLLVFFILTGCIGETELDIADSECIEFSNPLKSNTKAPILDLTKDEGEFGIFAFRKDQGGTIKPVFDNTRVFYDQPNNRWVTDEIRYWILNSREYVFYAFAPYDGIHDVIRYNMGDNGQMRIENFRVNTDIAKQKDILIARAVKRVNPILTHRVDFAFHHILTKVNFEVSKSGKNVNLKSFTLKNVKGAGDCNMNINENTVSANWTVRDDVRISFNWQGDEHMTGGGNFPVLTDLLLIPTNVDTYKIEIEYEENKKPETVTIALPSPSNWQPNKNFTYRFFINEKVNNDDVTTDVEIGNESTF